MVITNEQIRKIITDNNFTNVYVNTYLKEEFKDILKKLMKLEMDAVLGNEKIKMVILSQIINGMVISLKYLKVSMVSF